MHTKTVEPWKHSHVFDQDKVRPGERKTLIVIVITVMTMILEITAGLVFGSMALLADGLHMGSHATALGIALFAYIFARRHAHDGRFTFGTGKVNALGGYTGAVLLAVFALIMGVASFKRLLHPVEIAFNQAIAVAIFGLVVNGVCAVILVGPQGHHHSHHGGDDHHHHRGHTDHNLRSAYLHVLADALTSFLAIFALLTGKFFGQVWMDPAMGLVGAALVARWSWGLLRTAGGVLLDREGPESIRRAIAEGIEGEDDNRICDLHVWSIGPGIYSAIISLVTDHPKAPDHYKILIPKRAGLAHVAIEVHRCHGVSSERTEGVSC